VLNRKKTNISDTKKLKICENICAALVDIHDSKLVHGKITGDHVMINVEDSKVKLIDFEQCYEART
jgi:serine/threonine protein kinase